VSQGELSRQQVTVGFSVSFSLFFEISIDTWQLPPSFFPVPLKPPGNLYIALVRPRPTPGSGDVFFYLHYCPIRQLLLSERSLFFDLTVRGVL